MASGDKHVFVMLQPILTETAFTHNNRTSQRTTSSRGCQTYKQMIVACAATLSWHFKKFIRLCLALWLGSDAGNQRAHWFPVKVIRREKKWEPLREHGGSRCHADNDYAFEYQTECLPSQLLSLLRPAPFPRYVPSTDKFDCIFDFVCVAVANVALWNYHSCACLYPNYQRVLDGPLLSAHQINQPFTGNNRNVWVPHK